jgi:hypothetical protein
MTQDEILFQQYKLYTEQKEQFANRSFYTNKFYLTLILLLILVMFLTKDLTFNYGLSSILIFSIAGMALCTLWWINVDSYNFLLKVKLSKVVEDIEKRLPYQPYTQEFLAIKELRKNKKAFVFADVQKLLATGVLLLFFVLALSEIVTLIFG